MGKGKEGKEEEKEEKQAEPEEESEVHNLSVPVTVINSYCC